MHILMITLLLLTSCLSYTTSSCPTFSITRLPYSFTKAFNAIQGIKDRDIRRKALLMLVDRWNPYSETKYFDALYAITRWTVEVAEEDQEIIIKGILGNDPGETLKKILIDSLTKNVKPREDRQFQFEELLQRYFEKAVANPINRGIFATISLAALAKLPALLNAWQRRNESQQQNDNAEHNNHAPAPQLEYIPHDPVSHDVQADSVEGQSAAPQIQPAIVSPSEQVPTQELVQNLGDEPNPELKKAYHILGLGDAATNEEIRQTVETRCRHYNTLRNSSGLSQEEIQQNFIKYKMVLSAEQTILEARGSSSSALGARRINQFDPAQNGNIPPQPAGRMLAEIKEREQKHQE